MHVIGTAGHVDHGKSTLVHALTGIDPDRLAEEKAREMTIDLGFAWLTLNGQEVGIVDVPGHRDFIENMLAGVGGIDLALFVIAADEGVMPQTREHLAILDLLEVDRGIIALTKSDLVDDPDWLELVKLEVIEVLRGTRLANALIIPVSARTGAGIDTLKQSLANALVSIGEPLDIGKPRLPIDRVFTLSGFGTIVTGTLLDGSLRVGDDIEIQPGNLGARIRGLQTHKTKRESVQPGSRVAINLTGIDRDDLQRGQVVTRKGLIRPTTLFDAHYRHLPDADSPLTHNQNVKLFIGSAEVSARVRVIGREEIPAGEEGWIQLALANPMAAVRRERFILRRPSPGTTLGGGRVLDPHPGRRHRRFREDVAQRFHTLEQGSPEEIMLSVLARLGPASPNVLFEKAGLSISAGEQVIEALRDHGEIIILEKGIISATAWRSLSERVLSELTVYHREFPLRTGMDREDLRSRIQVPQHVFTALREHLAAEGLIVEVGTYIKLPGHEVRFSSSQESANSRLVDLLQKQGVMSPSIKECKAVVGDEPYFALVESGLLKPISNDVVYHVDLYDQLIRRLTDYLHQKGSISAPEARDLLGASRKYAIALLEHMDELRLTRRSGDTRLPARPL